MIQTRLVAALALALPLPATAQDVQVGSAQYQRHSAAVFFYQKTATTFDVYGQCEVTYGAPRWTKDHRAVLAAASKGQRLRLGKDGWTVLDTNVALRVGEQVIPAGVHYLALEAAGEGAVHLLVLDAAAVRKRKLFASMTAATDGGVAIPLHSVPPPETGRPSVEFLVIAWQQAKAGGQEVELILRWGDLEYRVALQPVLDGSKAG